MDKIPFHLLKLFVMGESPAIYKFESEKSVEHFMVGNRVNNILRHEIPVQYGIDSDHI